MRMEDDMMNKSERADYITKDEIEEILTCYRIGKKPLAKLLGWGETTIIRYMEGDVPTREYSDKLQYIRRNPTYFFQILEQNKENLTSVAYRKSLEALKEHLQESKISVVTQHIINRMDGNISLYELQTYLYYVQSFCLGIKNEPLFEDDYIINEKDMPYESILKDYSVRSIVTMEIKKNTLTHEEVELINEIVDALSWYGPGLLCKIMHYEQVMLKLSRDTSNRKIISKDTLKNYFKEIVINHKIGSPEQVHNYFNKMYINMSESEWNI